MLTDRFRRPLPRPSERVLRQAENAFRRKDVRCCFMKYRECHNLIFRILPALIVLCGLFLLASCGRSLETHLARGEELLEKRRFEEAAMQFRAATQIDESSAAAHWGLARAYEAQGRFHETVEALRRTADLAPDNLAAKARLGNYHLLFDPPQTEEAEKVLADILRRDPKFIEGHILRASILSARGRTASEVLTVLDEAIALDPRRTESYLAKARFYMKLEEADKAEQTIRRAVSVNDRIALPYLEYGRFLTYSGRSGEAEEKFLKAVGVEPKNIEAREALANHYLAGRELDKAERAYRDLVAVQDRSPESRIDLAGFYALVGRGTDAIKVYQEILHETPEYARARYGLTEQHIERKEFERAAEELETLFAANSADTEAFILRARLRLAEDNPEKAVPDLEEILKKQPSLQTALYYMAQARLALGQVTQARTFIGDLDRYHPEYRPTALLKIQAAFAADEPEVALREADKLVTAAGTARPFNAADARRLEELRIRGLSARGMANLRLGKTAEAERDLREVVRLAPASAGAKVNLARLFVARGELPEALELYENALADDRRSFDALSGMVAVLIRQREFDRAEARITEMERRTAGDRKMRPALHYLRADVLTAGNRTAAAEAELKKAIDADESYLPAYSAYAAILISRNQRDAALAQYRKVIELKPSASVHTLIGMLEDSRENHDAAEKHYRKALEIEPGAPIAANNLAWMIADLNRGNLDEALKLARDTVDRHRGVAAYYDTLGWVNYKKGFYAQAVESFRQAVALDETDARAANREIDPGYRLRLGMALDATGEKDSARREVALALRHGRDELSVGDIRKARSILGGE